MKDWLKQQVISASKSPPAQKVRNWLGLAPGMNTNHEIDSIGITGEVVVYFGDVQSKSYQLEQWLPVLEKLHKTHPVVLVFRSVPTMRHFRELTSLPKMYVRFLDDLVKLYDNSDFKVCLYVNNGVQNFQSLSSPRIVHVHINHGESDKLSMVSNQAKAYDKVFVAGPAAVERHRQVLIDFDLDKLISVGRPQLDCDFPSPLAPLESRTVMYAPTWEGENEANNYTSMDHYGVRIVDALSKLQDTRIIYKPHPRILTSTKPKIVEAHEAILELLKETSVTGSKHVVAHKENILALFEDVDALITDVSSVGLDFLYLHPDKPLILTDRRNNLENLNREVPVSRCSPIIDRETAKNIVPSLREWLDDASGTEARMKMRSFYFGDRLVGESTESFISALTSLITERQEKLVAYGAASIATKATPTT